MHRSLVKLLVVPSLAGLANAQSAVQWRIEEGGNGHWYLREARGGRGWTGLRAAADAVGGHLATMTSAAERDWLVANVLGGAACFLGGYQEPTGAEPSSGWRWITGEPFTWTGWAPGEPNNHPPSGDEDVMGCWPGGTWVDVNATGSGWPCDFALFEWSADCNGDGVVDLGQIRDGTFADTDSDGIPDACEAGFAASTAGYGTVPTVPFRDIEIAEGIAVGITPAGSLVRWGPYVVSPPTGTFVAATAGRNCVIAIRNDGTLAGFGANEHGRLNLPSGTFRKVSAADASWHAAGIRGDGTVACWGYNNHGQSTAPGGTFLDIAAGGHETWSGFTASVRTDGTLAGWGNNSWGQRNVPAGNLYRKVVAGYYHALAMRIDGTLAGWGWNANGQSSVPAGPFVDISCGSNESVALRADGTAVTFGAAPGPVVGLFAGRSWKRVQLICCEGAGGIESRDCDGDGLDDAMEITLDPARDGDANGVLDCCQHGSPCGCEADIDHDGVVGAEDLAAVLFAWGMPGGKAGGADVDRDGMVDADDLSRVLGAWGPCPG